MYPGAGPIDGMVTGTDGLLYLGLASGHFLSFNPDTLEIRDFGRPVQDTIRIPALENYGSREIFGIAGFKEQAHLFSFSIENQKFLNLGHIKDDDSAEPLFIGHDLCIYNQDTIYVGETDTAHRAGYLWECRNFK